MTLQCGTAIRDITPPYPAYMHGYANRDHRSTGISEPIQLGCLVLDDGNRQILIVTCDMIGIEAHVCDELYYTLEKEVGIPYPHALLSCSHTHFAPALHTGSSTSPHADLYDPDPRFVDDFRVKLVEAARESLRSLQPGRLETARLQAPQALFNRRTVCPDGSVQTNFRYPLDAQNYTISPTDTELALLRIRDDIGVKAVLANFGCHPVTGGQVPETDHYRVSADYPFYLRQTISQQWNCPVFFTLGAAGDAVPIDRYGNCRQRIGQTLGHTATLADRVFQEDPEPALDAAFQELDVATILTFDPAIAETEYRQARAQYAALQTEGADTQSPEYRQAAEEYAQKQIAFTRSRLYPENHYRLRTQFLRIGRTTLVALPFEVLSEISRRMKVRFPHSTLVSCAGGYQGYLPLEYEYARGGYEASDRSTHFARGTADRLLALILDWLEKKAPEHS